MISKIFILTVSAHDQSETESFLTHLIENLKWRLLENAVPDIAVVKAQWYQDYIAKLFLQHKISKADGGQEFLAYFQPAMGFLELEIESVHNIEYLPLPWLEEVIKSMHEDFAFVGSEFMYLIKDSQGALSFRNFFQVNVPNIALDVEEGLCSLDNTDYADFFDEYFHSGRISHRHTPTLAQLYLVGTTA